MKPPKASLEIELTDEAIRRATMPAGRAEFLLYDTKQEGLALRMRASGGRTWVYLFSLPGKPGTLRKTIGPWPKFREKAARNAATLIKADLLRAPDKDPNDGKRSARAARKEKSNSRERFNLGKLIGHDGCPYEVGMKARGIVNWKTPLSAMRRGLKDHLATDIKQLEREDIMAAVDAIAASGKQGAAADLRKHVYTFLEWCIEKGYIKANPLLGQKRPKKTRAQKINTADKSEGRALSDDEIIQVWTTGGKRGAFGLLVRMTLLGGARRSEPTLMLWKRNVMSDRITFDREWTKMGMHHDVPRTPLVDEVLNAARHFERADGEYVFPSPKTGGRMSGFTKMLDAFIEEAGIAKFTMHDLRRTLRTIMSRCGWDDDVQRACIGQKSDAFDRIYNKDEQWLIRKMAFDAAHDYIAALIGGKRVDNVIRLQRANNPLNQMKVELLGRLREFHASGATA